MGGSGFRAGQDRELRGKGGSKGGENNNTGRRQKGVRKNIGQHVATGSGLPAYSPCIRTCVNESI